MLWYAKRKGIMVEVSIQDEPMMDHQDKRKYLELAVSFVLGLKESRTICESINAQDSDEERTFVV